MNEFIIKKLTELLMTDSMDDYEAEILEYGIATMVLNLPKSVFLVIIAKKLGLMKPLLLVFLFYGIIRGFSRGVHAKTPLGCFIVGMANYLGITYFSRTITVPQKAYHAIYAYCAYVFYRYAPSGTEKNPMYKDQIKPLKIRSLLTVIAYYIIGLKKHGLIRNVMMLAVLSQSFSILPITYVLTKQKGGIVHEEE